jgi:hypothetical protein
MWTAVRGDRSARERRPTFLARRNSFQTRRENAALRRSEQHRVVVPCSLRPTRRPASPCARLCFALRWAGITESEQPQHLSRLGDHRFSSDATSLSPSAYAAASSPRASASARSRSKAALTHDGGRAPVPSPGVASRRRRKRASGRVRRRARVVRKNRPDRCDVMRPCASFMACRRGVGSWARN